MKNPKPHVALDIDGVLYPWDEAAATALEQQFGYENLLRDPDHWNALREQVSKEHWGWLFTRAGSDASLRAEVAYPGVEQGLQLLGEQAHLTFITHRPAAAAAATAQWIARMGCSFESLHVVGRNGSDRIPKWAVKPEADIYVEDRADNVVELLYNTERAVVLVPKRSYNSDLWDHDNSTLTESFFTTVAFNRMGIYETGFDDVVAYVRDWRPS